MFLHVKSNECRSFFKLCHEVIQANNETTILTHLQKLLLTLNLPQFSYFCRKLKTLNSDEMNCFHDSISIGQIESKLWLLEIACAILPPQKYQWWILGSWTGILAQLIPLVCPSLHKSITLVDNDPMASTISDKLLKYYTYDTPPIEIICEDMHNTYLRWNHLPKLIINTSCEHLRSIPTWRKTLTKGSVLIAQSSDDVTVDDHYSCVFHPDKLAEHLQPIDLLFEGSLALHNGNRHMVIGIIQ